MAWGFYPKINLKYTINSQQRTALIRELQVAFTNSKLKVTKATEYTIMAKKSYFFLSRMPIYVTVRVDEAGNVYVEGEMFNAIYDFNLIKKNINKVLDKLTIKLL